MNFRNPATPKSKVTSPQSVITSKSSIPQVPTIPKAQQIPESVQFYSDENMSYVYSIIRLQKKKDISVATPSKVTKTVTKSAVQQKNSLNSPENSKTQAENLLLLFSKSKEYLSISLRKLEKGEEKDIKGVISQQKMDKNFRLQKIKNIDLQAHKMAITTTENEKVTLLFSKQQVAKDWKIILNKFLYELSFKKISSKYSQMGTNYFFQNYTNNLTRVEEKTETTQLTANKEDKQILKYDKYDVYSMLKKYTSPQKPLMLQIIAKITQYQQLLQKQSSKNSTNYEELKRLKQVHSRCSQPVQQTQPNLSKDYFEGKFSSLSKLDTIESLLRQINKKSNSQAHQANTRVQTTKYEEQIKNLQKRHSRETDDRDQQIESLRKLTDNLEQIKKELQTQIKQFQIEAEQLKQQKSQLGQQISEFSRKELSNQQIMRKLKEQVQRLNIQHNSILQKYQRQIQGKKDQISTLKSEINAKQRQIDQAYAQQQQRVILEQDLQSLSNRLKEQQIDMYFHHFQGQILHSCLEEKIFLKESIQKYLKKDVLFSNIIYKYDPLNTTNYHKYFDQHQNICLIIRLKNGRLIAGFSQSPVSATAIAKKGGVICSLTQKKAFKLYEGKRSVTYDTFFLIFGNSELRLKHGEAKFFTNFGIANSFYESNGEKYTVLSGESSQREEPLDNFEIFKVHFK